MEVVISAAGTGQSGDIASLRAWLDSAGDSESWDLAPQRPASGTLGFGADEICAIITAAEGLVPLIQWISNWRTTKQDPAPITLKVTIGAKRGEVSVELSGIPENRDAT